MLRARIFRSGGESQTCGSGCASLGLVIVIMTSRLFTTGDIHPTLLHSLGGVNDLQPPVAVADFFQQQILERHVDLEKHRRLAERENLVRRRLEGVRVLARLDQRLDLHVLPADLLHHIRQRRNAGEHLQAGMPDEGSSVADAQPPISNNMAASQRIGQSP